MQSMVGNRSTRSRGTFKNRTLAPVWKGGGGWARKLLRCRGEEGLLG